MQKKTKVMNTKINEQHFFGNAVKENNIEIEPLLLISTSSKVGRCGQEENSLGKYAKILKYANSRNTIICK